MFRLSALCYDLNSVLRSCLGCLYLVFFAVRSSYGQYVASSLKIPDLQTLLSVVPRLFLHNKSSSKYVNSGTHVYVNFAPTRFGTFNYG